MRSMNVLLVVLMLRYCPYSEFRGAKQSSEVSAQLPVHTGWEQPAAESLSLTGITGLTCPPFFLTGRSHAA